MSCWHTTCHAVDLNLTANTTLWQNTRVENSVISKTALRLIDAFHATNLPMKDFFGEWFYLQGDLSPYIYTRQFRQDTQRWIIKSNGEKQNLDAVIYKKIPVPSNLFSILLRLSAVRRPLPNRVWNLISVTWWKWTRKLNRFTRGVMSPHFEQNASLWDTFCCLLLVKSCLCPANFWH